MKEYSIIHNSRNQLTLVEEPVIGNPLFTSCPTWAELFEQLGTKSGVTLNYYRSVESWSADYRGKRYMDE